MHTREQQLIGIWCEVGTQHHIANIPESDRHGSHSFSVWGSIMVDSRTELQVLEGDIMTGQDWCNEVILPHVHLFESAIGPYFTFRNNNNTPHYTVAVVELFESENIQ